MSEFGELPFHPTIPGLQAIGIGKRGPWWPIMGGSEGDGAGGGDQRGAETGPQGNGEGDPKSTETVEFWKAKAREQEKRAKENATAAKELEQLKEANKTEAEKAADRLSKAESEAASVPAKVAEALKAHLVARHQIGDEDAELLLTAADPELLLKQVDRLLGQSDKRRKNNNYVPGQGANTKDDDGGKGLDRQFVRDLFGNNN